MTCNQKQDSDASPSVLDLLDTQLGEAVWVVSQVEGVEGASRVEVIQTLHSWSLTVSAVCLSQTQKKDLQKAVG